MTNFVRQIMGWLKAKRTSKSVLGYVIHMAGILSMLGLSIYWWRAWAHLLMTAEAVLYAYKWSEWHGFYWLDAIIAAPVHIFSEPVYCLQLFTIGLIVALTVNKAGYYSFVPGPKRSGLSGAGIFSILWAFRR